VVDSVPVDVVGEDVVISVDEVVGDEVVVCGDVVAVTGVDVVRTLHVVVDS